MEGRYWGGGDCTNHKLTPPLAVPSPNSAASIIVRCMKSLRLAAMNLVTEDALLKLLLALIVNLWIVLTAN